MLEEGGALLINEFPIRSRFVGGETRLQELLARLKKEYSMKITFPFSDAGFCNIATRRRAENFQMPVFQAGEQLKTIGHEKYPVFTYK